jgi:hypothetical protein
VVRINKKKKEEMIELEKERLIEIFDGLSESKMRVAKSLIERVAFMKITLEILEDKINTRGPTYLFKNGSQKMEVENPAQKSYNTMINRFTTANEKLFNLLPKDNNEPTVVEEVDDFEEF